jgi:hypothetical protein
MVAAPDLKSGERNFVSVRVRPPAPKDFIMIDDSSLPFNKRKNGGYSKWVLDSWRNHLNSIGYTEEVHRNFIDNRYRALVIANDSNLSIHEKIKLLTKRK